LAEVGSEAVDWGSEAAEDSAEVGSEDSAEVGSEDSAEVGSVAVDWGSEAAEDSAEVGSVAEEDKTRQQCKEPVVGSLEAEGSEGLVDSVAEGLVDSVAEGSAAPGSCKHSRCHLGCRI
jgi:hypothetical protein